MIYANAIVDVLQQPSADGRGLGRFRVEVWGREPHDYVRVYEIAAKTDSIAAREGLDRFVDEIGRLIAQNEDD